MLIIPAGVVPVSVSGCRIWFLCPHGVMRTRSNRAPECEWACYMKIAKPDPYRFAIPDDTTPPAHAETDETPGGDAPEPGTSIEWTDLHMPVFNT